MFIKPSKKWRNPEGNDQIMAPYTYRICDNPKLYDTALGFYGKSLHPEMARSIGAEYICLNTIKHLGIREFLMSMGWTKEKITKDTLYKGSHDLYRVHKEMEDSDLCKRGRSKEKRDDCKIVVLAAVVNCDGLLTKVQIYNQPLPSPAIFITRHLGKVRANPHNEGHRTRTTRSSYERSSHEDLFCYILSYCTSVYEPTVTHWRSLYPIV